MKGRDACRRKKKQNEARKKEDAASICENPEMTGVFYAENHNIFRDGVGVMQIVRCDRLGRIVLDKSMRKKMGNTFAILEEEDKIVLMALQKKVLVRKR